MKYFSCIITISLFFCCLFLSGAARSSVTVPPDSLETLNVVVGDGLFHRDVFSTSDCGVISDMAVDVSSGKINVVGSHGAAVYDLNGHLRSSVKFSQEYGRTLLVLIGKGRGYEYLFRGEWVTPSVLIDSSGKAIWIAPEGDGVDDAIAGDFLGNGRIQEVVSYNGGTGVAMYSSGKLSIWKKDDGDAWHVETFIDEKTKKRCFVNTGRHLTVRDIGGKTLSAVDPKTYVSTFSLCRWPKKTSHVQLLVPTKNGIEVMGFDGNVIAQLTSLDASALRYVTGKAIRLAPGKPDYFAVVECQDMLSNRSVLQIFDPSGKPVYEEILPENANSLLVLPAPASKPETLLVGGTKTIWRY